MRLVAQVAVPDDVSDEVGAQFFINPVTVVGLVGLLCRQAVNAVTDLLCRSCTRAEPRGVTG